MLVKRSLEPNPSVSVNIRALAFGGEGVGEVIEQSDGSGDLLGVTAFVPYSAPGDQVKVRVTERRKRFIRGEILDFIVRSSERAEPRCPIFGKCGGCELQHMSYDGQLRHKTEMIRSALRAQKLPNHVIEALRPVQPASPFGYRRRVIVHVDSTGRIGFYRPQSRTVVATEECPIADEKVNEVLKGLHPLKDTLAGCISSIVIEVDSQGPVLLLRSPFSVAPAKRQALLSQARRLTPDVSIQCGDDPMEGTGRTITEVPVVPARSLTIRVPLGGFSQVNVSVNLQVISHVIDSIDIHQNPNALDLYAGAGNFALPLARAGASVIAVETDPRLVDTARQTAVKWGVSKRLTYVQSSVEKFLKQPPKDPVDVIIADPPRSGLGQVVSQLPAARKLVLVSCDLSHCAYDLQQLTATGWTVISVTPFDMFPQTSYTEIVSVCEKRA